MIIRRLLTVALLLSALLVAFKPELKQADHIAPAVAMDSAHVRTFDPQASNIYRLHTPNELYQRTTKDYHVQYVPTAEERYDNRSVVVTEHDARRGHRGQTWRRMA